MSYTLEVCVDSVESAIAAEEGGADRIELCNSLIEGGVTPSHGLVQYICRNLTSCKVYVLIRPRGGDFLYSDAEIAVMKSDIIYAASCGAHGVVLGCLTADGHIDTDRTTVFVELCSALGLDVTFHRAFDVVRDQITALSALIGCGIRRILTSGGNPSVMEGIGALSALVSAAGDRASIMPGGGVSEDNAKTVLQCTGAREIHGSFRLTRHSGMRFFHPSVNFGGVKSASSVSLADGDVASAWTRGTTDVDTVRRLKSVLTSIEEEQGSMGG